MSRSIVFLSDFGYHNEWVGICHAVIDKIAPGTPVVDLSHGVPPLDVRDGMPIWKASSGTCWSIHEAGCRLSAAIPRTRPRVSESAAAIWLSRGTD